MPDLDGHKTLQSHFGKKYPDEFHADLDFDGRGVWAIGRKLVLRAGQPCPLQLTDQTRYDLQLFDGNASRSAV